MASAGPFSDVLREPAHAQVRYFVAGGVAEVMHGIERVTFHLGLVI